MLLFVAGRMILRIEKVLDRKLPNGFHFATGALFLQVLLQMLNGESNPRQLAKVRPWEETPHKQINRQCHYHCFHYKQR